MSELIPPDPERCQTEITDAHGPFRLGPKPKPRRCSNLPTHIATEGPRADGLEPGSMSVCASCLVILLEQMEGIRLKAIERIPEVKS